VDFVQKTLSRDPRPFAYASFMRLRMTRWSKGEKYGKEGNGLSKRKIKESVNIIFANKKKVVKMSVHNNKIIYACFL